MLEKIPTAVGAALSGLKAGMEKTAYHAAFADIPARFTADGPGTSPPLAWEGLPAGASSLVLLVEDAGSPTPQPLVHLIVWNLSIAAGSLAEGALPSPDQRSSQLSLGQNSFLRSEWLPPDPPSGHGNHAYVFQLYALRDALDLPESPGRSALLDAMHGHVIGKGRLIGTYARV